MFYVAAIWIPYLGRDIKYRPIASGYLISLTWNDKTDAPSPCQCGGVTYKELSCLRETARRSVSFES